MILCLARVIMLFLVNGSLQLSMQEWYDEVRKREKIKSVEMCKMKLRLGRCRRRCRKAKKKTRRRLDEKKRNEKPTQIYEN